MEIWILAVILILILVNLIVAYRIIRPNGVLHIDSYTDKDIYRMVYYTPVGELANHKYLLLKVETQEYKMPFDDLA